jgi:hypothetical protein
LWFSSCLSPEDHVSFVTLTFLMHWVKWRKLLLHHLARPLYCPVKFSFEKYTDFNHSTWFHHYSIHQVNTFFFLDDCNIPLTGLTAFLLLTLNNVFCIEQKIWFL